MVYFHAAMALALTSMAGFLCVSGRFFVRWAVWHRSQVEKAAQA